MSKVTRWFPPDVKPVHVGSYETRRNWFSKAIYASWWDGHGWQLDSLRHEDKRYNSYSADQLRPWRGLREKPE